jgi:hypothetical protein
MKFSKPITREIDIDGNAFNVTFSDTGIEFRLKGKRKTARADWATVLGTAQGEQGESAHDLLGIERGSSAQRTQSASPFNSGDEATESSRPFQTQGEQATGETNRDAEEERSRSASAGEVGPES